MKERTLHYEPHPVSPARKAELVAAGCRIVDAKFAPRGWQPQGARATPSPSEGMPAAESTAVDDAPVVAVEQQATKPARTAAPQTSKAKNGRGG